MEVPLHIAVDVMRHHSPELFDGRHARLMSSMRMFTSEQIAETIERRQTEEFVRVSDILEIAHSAIRAEAYRDARKFIEKTTRKGLVNRQQIINDLEALAQREDKEVPWHHEND